MIPILFDSNATQFDTNGLGRLIDCISCEVTEERNGVYECEFVYPIDGRNYDKITLERIIAVTHDDTQTLQPFVIYKKSVPINGQVTFNAHHISYRLANVVLEPYTAGSCAEALSLMPAHSINDNPFSFYTDKQTTANFKLAVPRRCKEILGGVEGSILDTFGTGEYEFDGFNVNLWQNRGSVTGVEIRYGKNLTDITDETDASGKCNAVIPFWQSSAGDVVVTLPELAVYADDAPLIYEYWTDDEDNTITDEHDAPIDFRYVALDPEPLDLSQDFETEPTITQLRDAAKKYLAENRTWSPARNIELDFVQLWQTDEYARFAALERVKLCDTVRVICPDGEDVRIKVVKTVYDVLLDRYSEMELGEPRTTLAETIAEAASTAIVTKVPTKSQMAEFVSEATRKITGGLGGHVVIGLNANGEPNEILIMDTNSIETAVNVIRINEAGLGFSNNGYNGEFSNAWTIDGILNADFIRAGTLVGDVIKGGVIRSLDDSNGSSYWDLNSGQIQTTGYDSNGYASQLSLVGGTFYNRYYSPSNEMLSMISIRGKTVRRNGEIYYGQSIESDHFVGLFAGAQHYIVVKAQQYSYPDTNWCIVMSGSTIIHSGLTVTGGVWVDDGGLDVRQGGAEISGAVAITGTLSSSGRATVGSLVSNGIVSAGGKISNTSGGLEITGASTLGGKLTVSSGGEDITGASTLRGKLTVTTGGMDITGSSALGGALTVTSSASAPFTVNKDSVNTLFTVDGSGNGSVVGNFTVGGNLNTGTYTSGGGAYSVTTGALILEGNNSNSLTIRLRETSGGAKCARYNARAHVFANDGQFLTIGGSIVQVSDYNGSSIDCSGDVTATNFVHSSDERLKNFSDWDDHYDELFDAIEPRIFEWKSRTGRKHIGVSAQATRRALEDAGIIDSGIVGGEETETEYLNVDYNSIMMLAVKKIKDQQKQIDILMARLDALEGRLNADT